MLVLIYNGFWRNFFGNNVNDSLNQIQETMILMKYYNFDLHGYQLKELMAKWTKIYPHNWLPLATIEAIYQGRLKAVSVEQILNVWQKKGKVKQSFNYEFIRLIKPDISSGDIDKYLDIHSIFMNGLVTPENLLDNRDTDDSYSKNIKDINKDSTVNNFYPLEDFSHCFQKLKAFVIK